MVATRKSAFWLPTVIEERLHPGIPGRLRRDDILIAFDWDSGNGIHCGNR
jgi:hypothetical protein